ncbi:MAG: hypothetical protein AAGC70_16470 [Pseudomonadota bacterium]
MSPKTSQNRHIRTVVAAAFVGLSTMAALSGAAVASSKYKSTAHGSFHDLKSHANTLKKSGVVKVKKVKRHGRTVGFTKTFKSGDKVTVRRARHGKARVSVLKRKKFLQRSKHRLSRFKDRVSRTYRAAKAAWSVH